MVWQRICILFVVASLAACSSMKSSQSPSSVAANSSSSSSSGTGTLLIQPVVYAADANVRQAVKNECQLPEKLSGFIRDYAEDQYANIETGLGAAPKNAQILKVEIIDTSGAGGGAWSGGKMVMIKGSLSQNGKALGDFKGRRFSGGGMWGQYKGTCAILGRCVKALGKDVANWLSDPDNGAVLGDM